MSNIEEKKKMRFLFLQNLYNRKTEAGLKIESTEDICKDLGISFAEGDLIVDYLNDEGLLKSQSAGNQIISITHAGIVEFEEALSKPNQATEHFLPLNMIYVGEMHNSQIMQGSTGSNQTFNLTEHTLKNLEKFVEVIDERFSELQFNSDDDKYEAIAEIQTIKTQLVSPRPKELVIQESSRTLRNILEGMTGSILATELLKYLLGAN